RELRVTTSQPADPERILDYVASMSWVEALPDDERRRWLDKAAELVRGGDTPTELPLHLGIGLTTPARARAARRSKKQLVGAHVSPEPALAEAAALDAVYMQIFLSYPQGRKETLD